MEYSYSQTYMYTKLEWSKEEKIYCWCRFENWLCTLPPLLSSFLVFPLSLARKLIPIPCWLSFHVL
jgi:hypothetical protein